MVRALVGELDPARDLRFQVLELDGQPLAYHLAFQHARTFALYMTTFDLDSWNESPGAVLLRFAFEWAHTQGLKELDFTVGDEDYKTRYANVIGETYTVHFDRYPRTARTTARRLVRRTIDRVRRNPEMANHARRMRETLVATGPRLKHPAAFLRSAAGSRWPGVSPNYHTVVCRRSCAPRSLPGTVRRLTLKDLALLRLEFPCLDAETVEAGRRTIVEGGAVYRVSIQSAGYLFRVRPRADALPAPAVTIRDGAILGGAPLRRFADGLAALLGEVAAAGEVRIDSRYPHAVRRAARLAGCEITAEWAEEPTEAATGSTAGAEPGE